MTLENVPWAVEGGEHSAASARQVAYNATGGAEGIAGPLDLRVLANGSGNVVVKGGGFTILNRYANQANEAYSSRNVGDEIVAVPATGGTARTDLLVLRIDDPDFGGTVPADPLVGPYQRFELIASVPAGTTRFPALGRAYPAIALARLEIPANTTTITQAMIKDVRVQAVPKRVDETLTHALGINDLDELTKYAPAATERWPDVARSVYVPEWATSAKIIATWSGVYCRPGAAYGMVSARLGYQDPGGEVRTQEVRWDTPGSTEKSRQVMRVAADVAVPSHLRGKYVTFDWLGRADSGVQTAQPILDAGSAIDAQVTFSDKPALA